MSRGQGLVSTLWLARQVLGTPHVISASSAVLPALVSVDMRKASNLSSLRYFFGGSGAKPSPDALKDAERMLEVMANSPSLQQMMLAAMPSALRSNPDALKSMLSDPSLRARLAQAMAEKGVRFPAAINASHMEDTVRRLERAGVNITELPRVLMSYPGLFQKLQEPRTMQAFMETTQDPSAASKYPADIMEVVRKVQDILHKKTPTPSSAGAQDATVVSYTTTSNTSSSAGTPPSLSASQPAIPMPAGPSTTTTTAPASDAPPAPAPAASAGGPTTPDATDTTTTASVPPPPAATPGSTESTYPLPPEGMSAGGARFFQMLMADPAAREKLALPKVQAALDDIARNPLKAVSYALDRDVQPVLEALNKALSASRGTGGAAGSEERKGGWWSKLWGGQDRAP